MPDHQCSVRVYARDSCCLCDEVMTQLDELRQSRNFELTKVDISGDEWLSRIHGERIPVVEINGREIGWGRIPPGILEQHITQFAPPR